MSRRILFYAGIKRGRFWQFTWKYARNYKKKKKKEKKSAVEKLARM